MDRSSTLIGSAAEVHISEGSVAEAPEREYDPLLSNVELPFCAIFYPIGFAVEIRTNDKAVLAAATARSTSGGLASATWTNNSSVEGVMTSIRAPLEGRTHSPSMKKEVG